MKRLRISSAYSSSPVSILFSAILTAILFLNTDNVPARVSPQSGNETVVGSFTINDKVEPVSDEQIGREAFVKVRVLASETMQQDLIVFVPNRFLDEGPVDSY